MSDPTCVPNHHAHHAGFSGVSGVVAALSMLGRGGDARFAVRLAAVEPDDTVVDIGCGPGAAVRRAAALGATALGVDPARVMLRVARLFTHKNTVRYLEGTAEAIPLADDSATVLWSIATVHHWKDIDRGLAEARRVLRPGGRFVAIERHTEPGARGLASHGWTAAQAEAFVEQCRAHGFVDPRIDHNTDGKRTTIAVTGAAP